MENTNTISELIDFLIEEGLITYPSASFWIDLCSELHRGDCKSLYEFLSKKALTRHSHETLRLLDNKKLPDNIRNEIIAIGITSQKGIQGI